MFCSFFWMFVCPIGQSVISSSNTNKRRLFQSMAHLMDAHFDRTTTPANRQQIALFNSDKFIKHFDIILNSDQHLNAIDVQWAMLNIITKIAEWLMLNNNRTPTVPDDLEFLMCVWHRIADDSTGTKFNRTEIIRLLSHTIFGYPRNIVHHEHVCTCKQRIAIDWNGAALLFTSFDIISNG